MIVWDDTVNDWRSSQPEFATLEDAKFFACNEIERAASIMRARFLDPVSPFEAASWPIKQAEAGKVVTGGVSTMINIEAAARGITPAALAAKIIEKSGILSALEAQIAGTSGKHRDAINALTTIDQVQNYHPGSGWPV